MEYGIEDFDVRLILSTGNNVKSPPPWRSRFIEMTYAASMQVCRI